MAPLLFEQNTKKIYTTTHHKHAEIQWFQLRTQKPFGCRQTRFNVIDGTWLIKLDFVCIFFNPQDLIDFHLDLPNLDPFVHTKLN